MAQDIKRHISIPYAYGDDIKVDPHELYDMQQQILQYNRPPNPFEDIAYEILQHLHLNYTHYYGRPDDISEALKACFSDKDLMIKVFSDPRMIHRVVDTYKKYKEEQNQDQIEKDALIASNGVSHEDYEAAVDIADDFEEMGLDTLDEGQREIYEENLEIVKRYENS